MNASVVKSEALSLSPTERAGLIDALWDSLAAPELHAREAAWATEAERRIDAFEAGSVTARDAQDIFTDLKKRQCR